MTDRHLQGAAVSVVVVGGRGGVGRSCRRPGLTYGLKDRGIRVNGLTPGPAKAAVHLASDESACTAGTVLRVDGGIGQLAFEAPWNHRQAPDYGQDTGTGELDFGSLTELSDKVGGRAARSPTRSRAGRAGRR
ncbi:hypothetical protein ACIRL3_36435 [Streptomyces sp. NPDC102384]|uniref:hypothetical protein n=1 Tax=Streptomyces sp. NPDC102384 TaxID=3366166 RepID=UPI003810CE5C